MKTDEPVGWRTKLLGRSSAGRNLSISKAENCMGSYPSDRPQDDHDVRLPLNAVAALAGVAAWCASAADASRKCMVAVMLQMREGSSQQVSGRR